MSLTRVNTGDTVQAADVNQFSALLEGDSGGAIPVVLTQLTDATNPVLDIKNLSASGINLRIKDSAGNILVQIGQKITTWAMQSCRAYNSGNISIPGAAFTVVTLDSERFDTDGIHSIGSNTSRLTCVTAGTYFISATFNFASNATGFRAGKIRLNNTTDIAVDDRNTNAADVTAMTVSTIYALTANDYVELYVYQNSGGALNVVATANSSPEVMMVRVA